MFGKMALSKAKAVPGFNAMNDGSRYTQIDNEGGNEIINVYNLETGKKDKGFIQ